MGGSTCLNFWCRRAAAMVRVRSPKFREGANLTRDWRKHQKHNPRFEMGIPVSKRVGIYENYKTGSPRLQTELVTKQGLTYMSVPKLEKLPNRIWDSPNWNGDCMIPKPKRGSPNQKGDCFFGFFFSHAQIGLSHPKF